MKKTAFVLSGGGSRGAYEIGVWKALKELGVEIDMVFGTSVGAINGAMVAQDEPELAEKLWKQMQTSMIFDIDTGEMPLQEVGHSRSAGKPTGSATDNISEVSSGIAQHAGDNSCEGVSGIADSLKRQNDPPGSSDRRGEGAGDRREPESITGSIAAASKKLYDNIAGSVEEKFDEAEIAGLPAKEAIAYAREIVLHGGAGTDGLRKLLDDYIDEDRVRSSGLVYGLVVTGVDFPAMHGQYLLTEDIPEGRLGDYITASASCFPAARRYVIDGRSFIDGGYTDNMPAAMALQQGAERIFAVDLHAAGIVRGETVRQAKQQTEFHLLESSWELGSFLTFDKDNISRIMRLGYLDMMRDAGRYRGKRYAFADEAMTAHDIMGAEAAAEIIGLDPLKVYDSAAVINSLKTSLTGSAGTRTEFVLHIAESLGRDEADSPYIQPAVYDILEDYVKAANFLVKSGIVTGK
mgnify:CR=1 FL=1